MHFKYKLTGTGWAGATLSDGATSVELSASYLSDAPHELLSALMDLQNGHAQSTASWEEEPGEYRWLFHREGNDVRLVVLSFDDSWPRMPESEGNIVFSTVRPLDEVVRTLTQGLRDVLVEWGEKGYKAKWVEYPFPTELLDAVENRLRGA